MDRKIKIIRIITRLNNGGPARHVIWLTSGLDRNVFESLLVSGIVENNEDDISAFARQHNISPVFISSIKRSISPLRDLFAFGKILMLLFRERPDIVHTHTSKAGFLGRSAGFIYGFFYKCFVIHTFHGHTFHSYFGPLKGSIFLLIEKVLARLATDKIVVISELQFDEIHRKFGIGRKEQFEIVPLGVDFGDIMSAADVKTPFREEFDLNKYVTIGIVGRIAPVKNHIMFIDTAALLIKDSDNQNVKFVIVGGGANEDMLMLKEHAKAKGVENQFVFTGNRYDTGNFYSGIDIIVLTSLNEGTPLSLIEAMVMSKPFVATEVGGVRDLMNGNPEALYSGRVRRYENGILVDSEDREAFAAAVKMLMENRDMRAAMGENGRKFVETRHSREKLVGDIECLYLSLMGRNFNYERKADRL